MSDEEFEKKLKKNKNDVKKASEAYQTHSNNFNEKIKKLFSLL